MMFYLESFMKDCVYELKCGALAVAEREAMCFCCMRC